ncbi:MAG: cytochrome c3 family protein [Desulfuromusa sp.]|nr:cytochrome c3 family protein [Desulfuromusa sp.]
MFDASNWHMKGLLLLLMTVFLSMSVYAMDAPDSVTIDAIAKYYEPVEFDHAMHTDLAEDCSVCHHHSTGTGTTDLYCSKCHSQYEELVKVSCQDCHAADSFSAEAINRQGQKDLFHSDMIGLKGAYHQNCLGCHQEMDGPVGCEDCHAKTDEGEKLFNSGKYAPEPTAHAESGH